MKAHSDWSYRPYKPFFHETGTPYICRVVPAEHSIHVEWLPEEGIDEYRLYIAKRGEELHETALVPGCEYLFDGLKADTDWEFKVVCANGESRVRLARTGIADGTDGVIVNYLHPEDDCYGFSGQYLCSPCLLRAPNGHLLASMDVFAGDAPQNLELIFESTDEGKSWHYLCELMPCFWGRMFVHKNKLYMLGISTEYGDLLIGCSDDNGHSFCEPRVLLRGACNSKHAGVHKNPQPVVEFAGRIWNTCEWGAWALNYHAPMVFSCSVDDDPMEPSSWSLTPPVKYDPTWPGVAEGLSAGNIEGTLAVLPDGKLYNIMRYDMTKCTPSFGRVLAYKVNEKDPDAPLEYSHAIALPGNHSKFTIRFDPESGCYFTIISRIIDPEHTYNRNLLSLMVSRDCENWSLACDLIDKRDEDPKRVGFQYVDFLMEGDKLLWLCRTAVNHAHNFHDANYSIFHVIEDFRRFALPKAQ